MIECQICRVERDKAVPAAVHTAWNIQPHCEGDQRVAYCADHWADRAGGLDNASTYGCGCVLLEVIDLTKADPGPGYADMLRSL